ncbi:monosaccharide ABC transporter membrane protein, CUT2 family [Aminomonas paucivorans DSM 12260]|uniref:Monosaccharide ABC transporter membrane protein, CUT2 family n=1 Tax=Aminomonas paucivorans DSM 12260 TaxID=584708 RepID=E3D066_9BACT|nr:ABC transporter [Aminomonas paucivorans]EFQ24739.1 monosaccharide ABC transporter membrane protein, CUT2 family [Aminomonas paucivorans DSM 12260]
MNSRIQSFIEAAGWPRIIIGLFLVSLFVAAPFVGVRIDTSLSDTLVRVGMNGVMVLALVPMVQSGCGLNFGLPLGIIAGLVGAVTSIEMNALGMMGFFVALLISVPLAVLLGYGYGLLLNRVKGDEMMIATYVGFSSVAVMCMAWLLLPYKSPTMIWGYGGAGLRTTISVEGFWLHILSDFLHVQIGKFFYFPTGMFLFFALMCFLMWGFLHTKTGTAMTAVGSNPEFARASGINVDRMRIVSVVLSTVLGAVGILVYQQSFGFIQLYMGPFYMAFPAVAAILLGGASVNKASMLNVVVGTFLFQGILTMTPSVINSLIQTDMSEVIRIIVSNGMILYALTRKVQVKR